MQALKRFRAGFDGLATSLSPIVAQSCYNIFNVHTEIKLILILILSLFRRHMFLRFGLIVLWTMRNN